MISRRINKGNLLLATVLGMTSAFYIMYPTIRADIIEKRKKSEERDEKN